MNVLYTILISGIVGIFCFTSQVMAQAPSCSFIFNATTNQAGPVEEPLFQEKQISIEGQVLTKDGKPVEGAIVSINNPKKMDFITKSDGFFSFPNVKFNLDLMSISSIVAMATGYVAGITMIASDEIVFKQDVILPKGGILKGIVLDENHAPLSGVRLDMDYSWEIVNNVYIPTKGRSSFHLMNEHADLVNPGMKNRVMTTGEDGKFKTARLVPDAYSIVATCTGYQPLYLNRITVEDEKETNQEIVLTPSLKIAGLVTGPTGAPQEQVTIQLEKYDPSAKPMQPDPVMRSMANIPGIQSRQDMADLIGKVRDVKQTGLVDRNELPPPVRMLKRQPVITTKADGKFEFDQLEPGAYRIFARWIVTGDDAVNLMPYELIIPDLKPGDTNIRIQFIDAFKKRPSIKGTVIDKKYGDLLTVFSVSSGGFAKGYSGNRQFQTRENDTRLPDGEFLIKNIMPKPFTLWINSPGFCAKEVFVNDLVAGKEYDLFVALKREGKITGKLLLDDYSTLGDYVLELRCPDYQPQTLENMQTKRAGGKLFFEARVAMDGVFTFDILSSGTYQLLIKDRKRNVPLYGMDHLQVEFDKVLDLGDIHFDTPEAKKNFPVLIQSDDGTPVPGGNIFFPDFNLWLNFMNGKCDLPAQIVAKDKGLLVALGVKEPDSGFVPVPFQEQPPAFYYHIKEASETVLVDPRFSKQKNTWIIKGALYEDGIQLKSCVAKLLSDPSEEPLQVYSLQVNELGQLQQSIEASLRVYMLAGKESLGRYLPRPIRYGELHLAEGIPFVQVNFGKGKNAAGLVKNKDGESVPGALIQFALHSSAGNEIFDRILRNEVTQCIRADQYGLFVIPDLQPGTYTVWASLYGEGVSDKQDIVVNTEDIKKIEFIVK